MRRLEFPWKVDFFPRIDDIHRDKIDDGYSLSADPSFDDVYAGELPVFCINVVRNTGTPEKHAKIYWSQLYNRNNVENDVTHLTIRYLKTMVQNAFKSKEGTRLIDLLFDVEHCFYYYLTDKMAARAPIKVFSSTNTPTNILAKQLAVSHMRA